MNIKALLLTFITGLSTTALTASTVIVDTPIAFPHNHHISEANKSYARTIIAGSMAGAATGGLAKYILYITSKALNMPANGSIFPEKNAALILIWIASLIGENKLRKALVKEINQNFEEFSINHQTHLTGDVAWLASWIAYLLV